MTASDADAADDAGRTTAELGPVTVLLVDDEERWTRVTARLLERARETFTVETANSLAAGRERFAAVDPDCVVCDYQLGDGTGFELLETVRAADPARPFILVTGRGDERIASEAIGRGVTDYIRKAHDDHSDLLANRVATAVRTYRAERALERERRSKDAILDILTATATEAELRRRFCSQLVDRGYACAWIGTEGDRGTVVPEAVAGEEAYVEAVIRPALSADGDTAEPALLALERDELVVVRTEPADGAESAAGIGWASTAESYGFASAAALPVGHDGVRFGVLAVYAPEGGLIDERERAILREYAGAVGYALRNAKRRQALVSSTPVTVSVDLTDDRIPLVALADRLGDGAAIEVPSAISREDGSTVYLGRIEGVDASTLEAAVDDVEGLRALTVNADAAPIRCELEASGPTPERVAADQGARFERTVVEDGTVTLTVEVPDDATVGDVTSALADRYGGTRVATIWTDRSEPDPAATDDPFAALTDRQLEVLKHAFHAGYFERPRDTNVTGLADQLDIARTTVSQHLRAAQRKLLDNLL